jgi:hypothetical protein
MNYWWVNQGQTFREEISGGYIWSPTANRDKSRNQTYLTLREVAPGDLIFSYANGKIAALGIASDRYVEAERPVAFGKSGEQWAMNGWLVSIRWIVLKEPIRPRDYLSQIVPLLPKKYAPIRTNGFGNQKFYLTSIGATLGPLLVQFAQNSNPTLADAIDESQLGVQDDLAERAVRQQVLPVTEKDQLIRARRGQGLFRANVEEIETSCRLTGVNDKRFLVASHIKPWRESSNAERLDGNNGLLLSPHVDRLFDRGWISFANHGGIICDNQGVCRLMKKWGLDQSRSAGSFNSRQQWYLNYHRSVSYKAKA